MPIVGFEQYPVGADLCEGGCTVSLAAYNSGQRNIAAALANDANGPQLPAGGFSDVEPALFPAALGGGDVSSKGVELQANIGQVFGVAVSTNLYRAMQVAQGINFSADANFNPDLAPNITSSQYAAIVDNDNASIYKQDWSTLIGAAGIGKKVILARRLPISGAQAASNAYFLKTPCTDALSGSLSPATASDSSATFTVRESLNEYHVKSVLTRASTSGEFAIGVISLTSDWRTEPTIFNIPYNQYRWLKLNSVHPESGDINSARLKTKLGDYQFYSEGHYFVANTAGDLNSYPVRILNEINSRLNLQTNAYNTPSIYQTTNNLPRGVLINPACAAINGCALKFIHKGSANGNSCAPIKLLF